MNRLAMFAALTTIGLAAPAFAHEDHEELHQELAIDHARAHEQLDGEHEANHLDAEARHEALHESGNGWGVSHWLWHRREARRHRYEHFREDQAHADAHVALGDEHAGYHQPVAYAPQYVTPPQYVAPPRYGYPRYATPGRSPYRYELGGGQ